MDKKYLISYSCVKIVRTLHIYFIIRIFNGCELRIENSVTTVTVQHRKACRVMPNSYPEWRDFQFAPNNHYGFFSLFPSFQNKNAEICLLHSFLHSFVLSFSFPVRFVISVVHSLLSGKHCRTWKNIFWQVSIQQISRDATKKLQTDMCTQRRPRSAWASV